MAIKGNTLHLCRTQWFFDYTRPSSSPGPLTPAEAIVSIELRLLRKLMDTIAAVGAEKT